MSFDSDVKSKNTNLFPVVVINQDDPPNAIYLSTNSTTIADQYYTPILLNMPSLKESIDIERRNYKISNVNLSLSNYEHNGVRFSETVDDTSLINKSVDIYWISPSVTQLGDGTGDTDAKHIYRGWVLRYDMDPDKIKLVVEDRSQANLHRDLPIESLGDSEEVPNRYRLKPVPMVYGQVKNSPFVINKTYNQDGMGDQITMIADRMDATFNAEWNIKVFKDGDYCEVIKDLGSDVDSNVAEAFGELFEKASYTKTEQYRRVEDDSKDYYEFDYIEGESLIDEDNETENAMQGNTIFSNHIGVKYIPSLANIKLFTASDNFIKDNTAGPNPEGSWNYINNATELEDPESIIGFSIEDADVYTTWEMWLYRETRVFNAPIGNIVNLIDSQGVQQGALVSQYWTANFDTMLELLGSNTGTYRRSLRASLHPDKFLAMPVRMLDYDDGDDNFPNVGDKIETFNQSTTLHVIANEQIPSVSVSHNGYVYLLYYGIPSFDGIGFSVNMQTPITSLIATYYYIIDKFLESDYYGDVNGRLSEKPQLPEIIEHIMQEELGMDIDISYEGEYSSWWYLFCLNDTKNSKK